jgi:hypothetical protein
MMRDHSGRMPGEVKPRLILGLGVMCLLMIGARSTYLFLNGDLVPHAVPPVDIPWRRNDGTITYDLYNRIAGVSVPVL